MTRPIAVVTGMIATYPVGGVTWDYGQYALALERLGYDVWYLEDTGSPTYDPARGEYGEDSAAGVAFLASSLRGQTESSRSASGHQPIPSPSVSYFG